MLTLPVSVPLQCINCCGSTSKSFMRQQGRSAGQQKCGIVWVLTPSFLLCRAPVFLTLCHMMACATLGYLLSMSQFTPIKPLKSKKQLWKICLLATIFCITIVLGNLSLKYIPVSFNQAIGATTPFFTAIFAVMFQGKEHHTSIKR